MNPKPNAMKKLIPVIVALIAMLIFISSLSARQKPRIYNPELPKGLVFQWEIRCTAVPSGWSNESFSAVRGEEGLTVYYGAYSSLEEALYHRPVHTEPGAQYSLIPFFNQRSISTEDALILLSDRTAIDVGIRPQTEVISFSVYLGTFDSTMDAGRLGLADVAIGFEVLPNRTLAYAAGNFVNETDAVDMFTELQSRFPDAHVVQFVNGRRMACAEREELNAYIAWVKRSDSFVFPEGHG
ncbi:MAG: hypothetical protein Kow0075_01370 [Salibacteraceae bacterium]